MTLPLLVYLAAGILQTPTLEKLHLQARRSVAKTGQDDAVSVKVSVSVENRGSEAICLHLIDPLPPETKLANGETSQRLVLKPGQESGLEYTFQAKRGHFVWKHIQARLSDPLGLVETRLQIPAPAEIQIQPRLKKFKPFQMRPHSTLHSPGSIPARLGGSGTDFWGIREYHPGDSMRWLDWRLTARHPGKFFTKEFEQEEIAEIGLILDARRKTELRIGDESLFEYAIGAASSLAEMFLHQGHRVSLYTFGEESLRVYPGYGKIQLQRIMDCLSRLKISDGSGPMNYLDSLSTRMYPSHALLVIISPLTSSDWMFFTRLRALGYQVLAIIPDPIDFAQPHLPSEEKESLAMRAARVERQIKINRIMRLKIPVINWHVHEPLSPLVRHSLTRPFSNRRGW